MYGLQKTKNFKKIFIFWKKILKKSDNSQNIQIMRELTLARKLLF